jgi:hypothetical protein
METTTTSTENLEKKILVIEDEEDFLARFTKHGANRFVPAVNYVDRVYGDQTFKSAEVSMQKIDELLRAAPYAAILIDGKLGLKLQGGQSDGDVIAKMIRYGKFGNVNQQTPLYSISGSTSTFGSDAGILSTLGKPYGAEWFKMLDEKLGAQK